MYNRTVLSEQMDGERRRFTCTSFSVRPIPRTLIVDPRFYINPDEMVSRSITTRVNANRVASRVEAPKCVLLTCDQVGKSWNANGLVCYNVANVSRFLR